MPDAEYSQMLEPYSAHIRVRFDEESSEFNGKVYNRGDGNHAVFYYPLQASTAERTELAEFKSQTKWVVTKEGCSEGPFTDPDPKFAGIVSHAGYELIHSCAEQNEYRSSDGILCTYAIDDCNREVISTIKYSGAKISFSNVVIAEQDSSRFVRPC